MTGKGNPRKVHQRGHNRVLASSSSLRICSFVSVLRCAIPSSTLEVEHNSSTGDDYGDGDDNDNGHVLLRRGCTCVQVYTT